MNIYSSQTLDPIFNSLKDTEIDWSQTEPFPDLLPWNAGVTGYTTNPCSEETKNKISKAKKGKTPWNKGIPITEEQRLKNREAALGKILSKEHKNKISKSLIGRIQSDNQKKLVAEKLAKSYILTDPDGTIFNITNLSKFCKENGFDRGNMSRSLIKGWTCQKLQCTKNSFCDIINSK